MNHMCCGLKAFAIIVKNINSRKNGKNNENFTQPFSPLVTAMTRFVRPKQWYCLQLLYFYLRNHVFYCFTMPDLFNLKSCQTKYLPNCLCSSMQFSKIDVEYISRLICNCSLLITHMHIAIYKLF